MAVWEKFLGTAAALAVSGLAVAALTQLLKKQQDKINADLAASGEDALEKAAAELEAEEIAEAGLLDADAETVALAESAQPQDAEESPATAGNMSAQPDGSIEKAAPDGDNGPNQNPVMRAPQPVPRRADGKVDAEKICSPDDFNNWEDLGCQG